MLEGLRRNGVDVVICHETLWQGIDDRVQVASGGWLNGAFIRRVLRTYARLLKAYQTVGDYDVMVVGYPGQFDVYLARFLTWMQRKPLVLDVFMSLHLIAQERGLTDRHPLTAHLLHTLEWLAYRLPDRLIQDTEEYVQWFEDAFGLSPQRFRLVPTGADNRVFHPLDVSKQDIGFRVLYYGTFIPNHGVPYIVKAANLLKDAPTVHFDLVGEGPTKAEAQAMVDAYGLTNVTFVGWVDKERLPETIARADVCLGAFGATPQSLMTIQNKLYEGMAMGKPVVTGGSPAVRRVFEDQRHLYLCDRHDPQSLANALVTLRDSAALRQTLAQNGRAYYQKAFTVEALGAVFKQHLMEVGGKRT